MNFIVWIYLFSFIVANLFFITESKESYYKLSNFKIESIKYNDEDIQFCNTFVNDSCISSVSVSFNNRAWDIRNHSVLNPMILTTPDQLLQIDVTVNHIFNGSHTQSKARQTKKLDLDTTAWDLEFPQKTFAIRVTLKLDCQNGYLKPNCAYVYICPKLPPNVCRNNGTCLQTGDSINCTCDPGFTGNFCEEPVKPCQDNACSNNSICEPVPNTKLSYRCLCYSGYSGTFCHDLVDPCQVNFCANGAKCVLDAKETIGYRCSCLDGYKGRMCGQLIDKCALNTSLCSHFVNATCISTVNSALCYCEGGCKTHSSVTNPPDHISLPFKWPFNDFITFLIVVLEGIVILLLIILIIFLKAVCCRRTKKAYFDDNMVVNGNQKSNKESVEFGSNYGRQPIILEEINTRDSLNPMYDMNELQSFSNNQLLLDSQGMSTFGRR